MKILHLASEYPPAQVYGLGRFVHGLARAQARAGDRPLVLTNSCGGREDDALVDGVELHRIRFPNPPRPPEGQGEVLQFNHGLIERLLERKDRFADVDLVCGHDWLTALAAREASRLLGVPLVVTVHDEVVGKRFGLLDARERFVRELEALTCHDATHVIANSAYVAGRVTRELGVPAERVTAIPGGIDPEVVDVGAPALVPDFRSVLVDHGELLVAYVGRLDPEKGLETLAEAARVAAAADERLVFAFAGSGRLEAPLAAALAPLGRRARLLGYLAGETLAFLYRAADVVVVPSTYEPFGLVALEALLAGAATLVAKSGGLVEIVEHEASGLVVPAGEPRALADALLRLVGDAPLRERLAKAGAARARDVFSWDEVARRTREVYGRACAAPPHALCELPPAPPARPSVSALLRTRQAPVHAAACLRSLLTRTRYPALEVLVVDEGSSPAAQAALAGVVAELREAGHAVRVARSPSDGTDPLVAALDEATGELALLLDDELEVPPEHEGWLEGLVWLLEEREALCVAPSTIGRDGRLLSGAGMLGEVGAPAPLARADAACLLGARTELRGALGRAAGDAVSLAARLERWAAAELAASGRRPWIHPVRLVHAAGEARREPAGWAYAPASQLPVSIVLVAYDNLAWSERALKAVLAHTPPPYELVLVDNGSRDGTPAAFAALRDRLGGGVPVQLLRNATNLGYPIGANQGLRAARGRDVVLLNNDALVRPGWLEALLAAKAAGPRVGIVTAKVLHLDGSVQSAGGILHHPDGSFTIPGAGEDRLAPPVTQPRELESAGGPCMLLTRELLEAVGGFDEGFSPGYFEDSDLCLRARAAGFTLRYAPGAEVRHCGKATAALVARELPLWERFEENRRVFHARWADQLEADEAARVAAAAEAELPRRRILLCYHRSETTTAAYCEAALRREHDVVVAGRGQELDLGPDATAAELVAAAQERLAGEVDLLLVIEGETYVPPGLEAASCPTALWAIDTHLHAVTEEGWHFAAAPRFDRLFVAQEDAVARFAARGLEAHWLPLACDPDVHRGDPTAPRDLEVVFVGHVRPWHRRRRALLDRLARRFRVHEEQGVFREAMTARLARGRVVFNCSLAGDLNMRVFEALASGSLLVTDRLEHGLPRLFAEGEHLLLYDDHDLEAVVARALAQPEAGAAVAARGQRLVLAHHTYAHRMRELLRVAEAIPPARLVALGAAAAAEEARS